MCQLEIVSRDLSNIAVVQGSYIKDDKVKLVSLTIVANRGDGENN
jgi:hypothetical protein